MYPCICSMYSMDMHMAVYPSELCHVPGGHVSMHMSPCIHMQNMVMGYGPDGTNFEADIQYLSQCIHMHVAMYPHGV